MMSLEISWGEWVCLLLVWTRNWDDRWNGWVAVFSIFSSSVLEDPWYPLENGGNHRFQHSGHYWLHTIIKKPKSLVQVWSESEGRNIISWSSLLKWVCQFFFSVHLNGDFNPSNLASLHMKGVLNSNASCCVSKLNYSLPTWPNYHWQTR